MLKFKFKFEGLLKIRMETERQAQIELARVKNELFAIENKILENKEARAKWCTNYNIESLNTENKQKVVIIENYIVSIDNHIQVLQKQKLQKELEVFKAQVVAENAYKAKKQIEKIKETHLEIFRNELKKKEEKIVMEIVSMRSGSGFETLFDSIQNF